MRKILLATFVAGIFAIPALAQVVPTGTGIHTTPQTGISTTGTAPATGTENAAGSDATSTSNLGLGGLLQQQTQSGETGMGAEQPDIHRLLETKPRTKRAHGH